MENETTPAKLEVLLRSATGKPLFVNASKHGKSIKLNDCDIGAIKCGAMHVDWMVGTDRLPSLCVTVEAQWNEEKGRYDMIPGKMTKYINHRKALDYQFALLEHEFGFSNS